MENFSIGYLIGSGSMLAVIMSFMYLHNNLIISLFHGFLSWVYVIYFVINYQQCPLKIIKAWNDISGGEYVKIEFYIGNEVQRVTAKNIWHKDIKSGEEVRVITSGLDCRIASIKS